MADDQHDAIAFLNDASSYGDGVADVQRLQTHISHVFLAGGHAYKLKRAIAYPYLDFSTIEKRRQACEAELTLNRRTAPELYLAVRALVRRADGGLAWNGDGEVVDWVVVMRRFEQDRRLDAVAKAGGLTPPLLYALAAHIAEFHASAEPRPESGGAAGLAVIVRENDECLRGCGDIIFAREPILNLNARSTAWLGQVGDLLERRRAEGKVRRCHGDLHLRNICVLDDKPVLFDCLEFSEVFASIDVLYDLAFLLMDLEHQGHAASANLVFNRYLDLTGEDDGLAAMPLFFSLRAAIRAHVTAPAGGDGATAEARRYLDEACAALQPPPARLIAIGGLSGTGKSTLAAALAPLPGARPGARVLRSDVIRKRLFGLAPEARLPEDAYATEVSERVYQALRSLAASALQAGYCAIIDTVALRAEERQAFAAVAAAAHVPFTGIWLDAPAAAMTARVETRQGDASDATRAVVERQLQLDPGSVDWQRIDTSSSPTEVLTAAKKLLELD
jgi:aminoglycoside phosphotransferase family enzyme/predicted kinase